jgi:putative ABC transport system substrate-binding protein
MASRRTLLQALVVALASRALPSIAQQKPWRIGFLGARTRSDIYYNAFIQGLRDLGYVEGKNIIIEWRFADGDFERLPALAAELVKLKPDVLVTHATPPSQALARATPTIPIVAMSVTDPVRAGLVASLARSGNNVTGLSNITIDVAPKQVELLKKLMPTLARVAVLVNPGNSAQAGLLRNIENTGEKLGIRIAPIWARF